jgi:L-asparaginase
MVKKRISIISTGGTIAMSVDPKSGGAVPVLSGDDFLKSAPSLQNIVEAEVVDFRKKPGAHLTLDDILELSKLIKYLFKQNKNDGVIVTHGTDTLEETAYALDLLVPADNPIVITGAMKNASQPGYDGPANLINSALTVAADDSWSRGTMVVFNNEIHPARDVTKVSATQLNAFRSPLFGPIGIVYGNKVQFVREKLPRKIIPVESISTQVELIKFALGMSNLLLEAVKNPQVDGVVIEGSGVGHVSESFTQGIKDLIDDGKVVVLTTRCNEGLVLEDSYAFMGSEKYLHDLGVIPAPGLNGPKARIKLILALSLTKSLAEIRTIFNHPIPYN